MKRILLLIGLIVSVQLLHATNYYFSAISGDDNRTSVQAQNWATPWRTLDKLNAINASLKPGDSVFFKRGEVFYGTLVATTSGWPGNEIYYGAWGTGVNPVITGFTTLTAWTLHSGNIYYATVDMPNLHMVTLNGEAKGMGRFPNTGYLKYENNSGNTSITDNELPASPSWAGGEIVMRKYRFILDRHTITSHSGTTLQYGTSTINGNNAEFLPVKKNGYFIQNHLGTLDQQGEWYYDNATKRLYMHFGGSLPSAFTVKASTREFNASVQGVHDIMLENLSFEGANAKGLFLAYAKNILVKDCDFYNQGATSLYGDYLEKVTIKGGSINTSFSNGIFFEHGSHHCTVDGVSVYNSNTIAGMGRSGSGVSIGISLTGNYNNIINNRVIGSGYSGIQFLGDHILVERNFIDTFCTLKDDGGGVYTFIGAANTTSANRKIKNNIILNAVGARAGTEAYDYEPFGKAAGIYLDEHVNNVEITGNTVAHGDWAGIFLHNAHHNVISNNLFFNHRYQVLVSQYTAMTRNNTMTNNQYIARLASQGTFYYRTFVVDNPSTMGTFDNNVYARPISDNNTIQIDNYWTGGNGTSFISLAQWKSSYSLDPSSQKSPLTYASNIDDNLRFEYNAGNTVKQVSLTGSWIDVRNGQYAGTIGLAPFTGVVLLKSAATFLQNQVITFPAIADRVSGSPNFTLNATSSSGLPVSYSVVSGPASVSGNTVTLTGVGTVVIEATQGGNTSFKAATPVRQSFAVLAANTQTITFPAIANKVFGNAPFALTASATSGLPVSYRVVSGYATVSGNMLTITGAGIPVIIVEALQEGNSQFRAATPVRQRFNVARSPQAITFNKPADKSFGSAPFALTATASSGLPLSYRVTSGAATVSGNMVTLTGAGTIWIEASQPGNEDYEPAALISQTFYVTPGAQTINFPAIPNKRLNDPPFTLAATASSGLPVSYRVSSGPATISGNTVTLTGIGTVWIEALQPGNENYYPAANLSRSFTVSSTTTTKQNQTITFPAIANRVYGDPAFTLNATASSGLPVSYSLVSGPATVSGNTVTITGVGSVTIRASQAGNTTYNAATPVSQTFTVNKGDQSISFPAILDKVIGDAPFTLSATASSGLPVSYRIVSGPATLMDNVVTLVGTGPVMVEATQAGNTLYNPASPVIRSFNVSTGTSTRQSQSITFPTIGTKTFGVAPFALGATTSSGLPVAYRIVSGPATISGNTVTLTGIGTVTIEATQSGNEAYHPATPATQTFSVVSGGGTKQNQTITFGTLPYKTYSSPPFELTATASSGLPVSYRVVSGPATVTGNLVTITGVGSVSIEAQQPGDASFNPATPVVRGFTVGKAVQSITFPTPPNKTLGDAPFTPGAMASSGLPVSFRVVSGPATVSGNLVNLTGTGTVTIEASQPGDAYYSAAYPLQRSFTVSAGGGSVEKQNQTISFTAIGNKVFGDTPFSLTAIASSGLVVSFRVVSGPASVSGTVLTITGSGQVTVEASQAGNSSFNPATPVTQVFEVTKAAQTISFGTLANKVEGDAPFALSATASSGLPVTYRIVSGPATVAGNVVTLTGAGPVVVEAMQTGNVNYEPAAPVQRNFTVTAAGVRQNQTISFGTLGYKTYTSPAFELTATASSGLPVLFRVISGPISIAGNVVSITGIGQAVVEAYQDGNGSFNPATPVQRGFTIGKASQVITFNAPSAKTTGDAPFALDATSTAGLAVIYRIVSGPATVSGNTVTLTGPGTVTVEASQPGNDFYQPAFSLQRNFTVTLATNANLTVAGPASRQGAGGEKTLVAPRHQLTVFPNPMHGQGYVQVMTAKTVSGHLHLYDRGGKMVRSLGSRTFEKGKPVVLRLDVQGLTSGTYFVRLVAGESVVSQVVEVF